MFYDLTTVAVTGQTDLEDDVRAYGLAKSGLIERQFMLSLVQTAEGLPIAHEVHPGNTAEAKTLLPMIRGLLACDEPACAGTGAHQGHPAEVKQEYGWPKMWKELVARGIRVGKERVRNLMQQTVQRRVAKGNLLSPLTANTTCP